jgi:pyrimidine deaminase RibD-like protein
MLSHSPSSGSRHSYHSLNCQRVADVIRSDQLGPLMTPPKSSQKKRFAVGAEVLVGMSRQLGTVLHVDDEPSIMGEYVHIVQSKSGELKVVGCDLELVPVPQTNLQAAPPTRSVSTDSLEEREHSKFMQMAIEEARKSVPEDKRVHPKVGVVVVKDGKVLASAHRGEIPEGHAEFIALEKKLAEVSLAGATVYTTLEPCTSRNHPKVPCAIRLTERKVGRVVIGMLDPDDRISGRGQRALRKTGIATELFPNDLMAEVEELNREFLRDRESRKIERNGGQHAPPEFYNFNGSLGPISLSGIQHSVQGPWMDVWGLVTVVNPTQSHMKIGLHRLVLDGKECPVQRFFFRLKSDPREQFERISLMGNAKEHYEVHVMFPENNYPTPPPRDGELWVSSNGQEPFPVKVRCP